MTYSDMDIMALKAWTIRMNNRFLYEEHEKEESKKDNKDSKKNQES